MDLTDRQQGDDRPQSDRTEALVRLLWADGFEAHLTLPGHSSWGDVEVGERR